MKTSSLTLLMTASLSLALLAGCATAPEAPKASAAKKVTKKTIVVPNAPPVPEGSEIVLNNGMVVTAATPEGKITIAAGPGLLRSVSWDGTKRYVVPQPRKERLYSSKGIFFEGHPEGWQIYKGMSRIQFEEGQRQFENVDDAVIWMQIRRLHYVHSNNGLVVGWKRKTDEATLQVEVWQFFINGEKPQFLPESRDYLIQTRQAPVPISANTH